MHEDQGSAFLKGQSDSETACVLEANSQDSLVQEARSSWESQLDAESDGEIRSNTADDRVPGVSTSTVNLQDARRQNNVTKLLEMFT